MTVVEAFPREIREIENTYITLSDGCRLAVRMWLPLDAEDHPVPAILEYIPYRKRDGTTVRDQLTHPYFAGHGYACLRVDMRGNGESDGLMWDEYVAQEQTDAVEVIDWISKQDWCSGTVGMMGISWGGFNGLQVAALNPPPLKAVVTLCSTDDRYADDIHYKGGCLLNENLGWAGTMLSYSSRPPDPALVSNAWRDMWFERLENQPLLIKIWLEHPFRDDFWKHGSVCEDFSAIKAAVLAVGGWGDAYSNAIPRLLNGLSSPAKGIIGPWAHKYPHFAPPAPRIGFLQEALRWWDRWLKDIDTGVESDPFCRTYVMDSVRPKTSYEHRDGCWIAEDAWPGTAVDQKRFHLDQNGLRDAPGAACTLDVCSPQTTGADSGEYCAIWLGPEFPGDQRRDDSGSLTFDSQPLERDLAIVGAPTVTLDISCDKPVANLIVRLNDVWPDGAATRITYHALNLCHRDSHERPQALEPGETYRVTVKFDDIGYVVPEGHHLRLSVSTAYWPLIWPAPESATVSVQLKNSWLDLPVRNTLDDTVEMLPAVSAPPLSETEVRAPSDVRKIEYDQVDGSTRMTLFNDFGEFRDDGHGLTTGSIARETYTIHPDDPLCARALTHWTQTLSRDGGWSIRTEAYQELWADQTHFYVKARVEAWEGEEKAFEKEWDEKVKRRLL